MQAKHRIITLGDGGCEQSTEREGCCRSARRHSSTSERPATATTSTAVAVLRSSLLTAAPGLIGARFVSTSNANRCPSATS